MSKILTRNSYVKALLLMDTAINLKIVTSQAKAQVEESMKHAFKIFQHVENVCNRFNPESELRSLSKNIGTPLPVSDLLFEALRFALAVADFTQGAFDPTLGGILEQYGFHESYLHRFTGESSSKSKQDLNSPVSYCDVELDEKNRTVTLHKPLILDLGALAKGLAIDLAVKELQEYEGFLLDAGGDLYVGGMNEENEPWNIGLQHPTKRDEILQTLRISDRAICTSGSYERISPLDPNSSHLIDPLTQASPSDLLSCTVIAPFAMMADAFSTAGFVLGPKQGLEILDQAELSGVFISPSLEIRMTPDIRRYLECPPKS